MSSHTATTPTFVRTEAGVVRVAVGEQMPADVLPTEIARLVAGGVIESTPDADAADETPATRRSRGQSGTTKKG